MMSILIKRRDDVDDAEDLVLFGGSENDLKVVIGHSVEVCKRKGLRVSTDKNEVGGGIGI